MVDNLYLLGFCLTIILSLIGLIYANLISKIEENKAAIKENKKILDHEINQMEKSLTLLVQTVVRLEAQHLAAREGMQDIKVLIDKRFDDIKELIIEKVELAISRDKQNK